MAPFDDMLFYGDRNRYNGPLTTTLRCDRCNENNALRLTIVVHTDMNGNRATEQIDLCSQCIIIMTGALMQQVPEQDRCNWLANFKNHFIG